MENIGVTWCDHFRGCEKYHWNQHHFMAIYRMCDPWVGNRSGNPLANCTCSALTVAVLFFFLPCDCGWCHHWVLVWHVWCLKPATCNSSPLKTPCSVGGATIRAEHVLAEKTSSLLAYMVCGNYALNTLDKAF